MSASLIYLFISVIGAGVLTFLLRAGPIFLPEKLLHNRYIRSLNFSLPMCVMALLLLSSLAIGGGRDVDWHMLCAQVIAIAAVLAIYAKWRNVLLGMISGVAMLNLCLFLFKIF